MDQEHEKVLQLPRLPKRRKSRTSSLLLDQIATFSSFWNGCDILERSLGTKAKHTGGTDGSPSQQSTISVKKL